VKESVEVDFPVRTAYNEWTQFSEFPNFMKGVEEVTQLDESHNHWTAKIGGVRRKFDTEIVDQLPDERIAWRTISGDAQQTGMVHKPRSVTARWRGHRPAHMYRSLRCAPTDHS
jgi:uncharacterized membrane protein